MSEHENGRLPLAKRTVRSRISADVWQHVKTAYANGIGLREIARNMSIPEGTVLARAKRGWTQVSPRRRYKQNEALRCGSEKSKARARNHAGEKQWNSKLSAAQVEAIRAAKDSQSAVAKQYGISQGQVSLTRSRQGQQEAQGKARQESHRSERRWERPFRTDDASRGAVSRLEYGRC